MIHKLNGKLKRGVILIKSKKNLGKMLTLIPDEQFLVEEDEWNHLPSEDEYNEPYEEGRYF